MAKKTKELTIEEKLENALVPDWEQPYKLPENWCWTRLDSVSEIVTGGTPSKKNDSYYGGEFPFIKPADLDQGRNTIFASEYLTNEGKNVSRVVRKGSTSVCCIGTIGKCGFLEVEAATNQQINTIIPMIEDLFIYYYSCSNFFVQELVNKASATTISIVNKSKMSETFFPLPPLSEQKRIVERIESLFSKLDEAKELAQNALDSFENRKSAILHKAFSGELTKKWREESGVEVDSWEETAVGDICGSIVPGRDKPKSFTGDIPWITTPCITDEYIDEYSAEFYLSEDEIDNVRAKIIPVGSVIMTCVGRFGICAINRCKCVINQQLHAFLPSDNIINKFLIYNIEYLKDYMSEKATSTTVAYLNKTACNSLPINLPTLPEQQEIVRILDSIFEKETEAKELVSVIDKIELIKKTILSKAFRGELGTNDKEEESSVGLLREMLEGK